MPTISALWDIKSLIEHHASIQYANKGRPSTSNGIQEYHSNCPFCGGTDRFIVRPTEGTYNCCTRSSGCDAHGDCIDFLKDYMHMTHSESCDFLGIEHNADFVPSTPSQTAHVGNEQPPNAKWIETGLILVERAVHALWNTSEGRLILDYLHGRGLGDEIIKKKKIGFIPLQSNGKYYESELQSWGLDPEKETKDKVRVPPGILIPWFDGSTLWRLALKRPVENQYGQVLGSGEGLFNVGEIQYDTPAMIVEGEICAMSVEQECGDLVACVATGSTTRGRLNKWIAELGLPVAEKNGFVLQSFDEDVSGDVGSEYWAGKWDESMKYRPGVLKRCMRWSPYIAKDPNDILRGKYFEGSARLTLREWVEMGIENAKVEFGISRPFVLPLSRGIASVPTTPLARGDVKQRKDFPVDLSKTKWHGPEVDMKALSIREYVKSHLALGMCLNPKCPCGT